MSIPSVQSKYPNAIWFDSNHGSTGTGTVSDPYNNITTAIGDITSNDNVIAIKDGTHSITNIGGSSSTSSLSLGGTADTLTLVGVSTNAVLSSTGTGFGTLVNLSNKSYAIKIETLKAFLNGSTNNGVIYGGNGSSSDVTVEGCILEMGSTLQASSTNYGFIRSSSSSTVITLTVKNSIFIGAANPGELLIGFTGGFNTFDCQNNTIINASGNATKVSRIGSFSGSSIFKNNIFVGTGTNNETLGFTPSSAGGNCYHNTGISSGSGGVVFADPIFVDSTNGDYRLRPTSPCIGAGTAS